jgi:hypothetical protein
MSKTLILKPRRIDKEGHPAWHDKDALDNLISNILKNMQDVGKKTMWFNIAGKMEESAQEIGYGEKLDPVPGVMGMFYRNLPPIPIELSNQYAHLLWKEIDGAKPSWFFLNENVNSPGLLTLMQKDIATQLEEKWVEPEAE